MTITTTDATKNGDAAAAAVTKTTTTTTTTTPITTSSSTSSFYRIEPMSDEYLSSALDVAHDFLGGTYRKRACCILPLSFLPLPMSEFQKSFATENAKSFSAIAIRNDDNTVIGLAHMTDSTMWRDPISQWLHDSVEGEAYIEMLCVLEEYRGQGIGKCLLEFCEDRAKERNMKTMALGVVKKNPAIHLYERFGFQIVPFHGFGDACLTCLAVFCIMGCPYWGCGGVDMVKELKYAQ